MKKNLKVSLIAIGVLCCLGGYTALVVNQTKTSIETEYSDKVQLKKDTLNYLTEPHTPDEIETTLINAFEQLSKKDNTEILDMYIYGTYNIAAQAAITDEAADKLYQVMNDDKTFNIDVIEDNELVEETKKFMDEHLALRFINGQLFWDVDYGYFAETFKDYITPDYYDMLTFYELEKAEDYYDSINDLMYTDVVESRLDMLYTMLQTYSESTILPIINECYNFYKAVYFGGFYQSYVWTDDAALKDEIYEAYKLYAEEAKDPEIKEFTKKLISNLDEVDRYRTAVIMEDIKEFCGIPTAESNASESSENAENSSTEETAETSVSDESTTKNETETKVETETETESDETTEADTKENA